MKSHKYMKAQSDEGGTMEDDSKLASLVPRITAVSVVVRDPPSASLPHPHSSKAFIKLPSRIDGNTLVLLDACPLS